MRMRMRICRGYREEEAQRIVQIQWGLGWLWAPCECVQRMVAQWRMLGICCTIDSLTWAIWLHLEGWGETRLSWVSTELVPVGTPAVEADGWVNWERVQECHRGECFEVWSSDWEVQGRMVLEWGTPNDIPQGQYDTPYHRELGTSSLHTQTLPAPHPHSSMALVRPRQFRPSLCRQVHLHSHKWGCRHFVETRGCVHKETLHGGAVWRDTSHCFHDSWCRTHRRKRSAVCWGFSSVWVAVPSCSPHCILELQKHRKKVSSTDTCNDNHLIPNKKCK